MFSALLTCIITIKLPMNSKGHCIDRQIVTSRVSKLLLNLFDACQILETMVELETTGSLLLKIDF